MAGYVADYCRLRRVRRKGMSLRSRACRAPLPRARFTAAGPGTGAERTRAATGASPALPHGPVGKGGAMHDHDEDLERIRARVCCTAVLEGTQFRPARDVARASCEALP